MLSAGCRREAGAGLAGRDAISRAKQLQDLQQQWRQQFTQARSSALLVRLVDSLFERPILTIPQAGRLLEVTYHSAQRSVLRLVESGILHEVDVTSQGRLFVATAILRVLESV